MTYEVRNLTKWTSEDPAVGGGDNYMGDRYEEYYVVIMRTRDSETLTESNFFSAKNQLEGLDKKYDDHEEDFPYVLDVRTGHWGVGWFETIMVYENSPDEILQAADEIVGALADYPVLDEEDYYKREEEEKAKDWGNWENLKL